MNDHRALIRNSICIALCVLATALIGYLYYTDQQQEKAQTAALESLQEEVEPYETKLRELQAELTDLGDDVSYSAEEAGIMVGFVISEESNLTYIEEKAATYQFSPVLVLDCTMDMEVIEAIIEAADEDWEIMLYAPNFSEDVNEDVLAMLSYLESIEREQCGVFFLRTDYNSEANLQRIVEDGFVGYTSYHESSPVAGQADNGMIYFDYSYLTTTGTAVTSRLYSLYSSKSSMIVTFDMASIDSGALPETYVTSLLDVLQTYASQEDCAFITVAEAVSELSQVNSVEADNQAAYEEQAAVIEAQIEELKETIAGIYEKWGAE